MATDTSRGITPPGRPPNVLLIIADQLRADALGCYGNPIVATPNLDALAARGVRFDSAMTTQPTCTPARASILTDCYASAVRSRMVGCRTPDDPRFLPRLLRVADYHTASIGKIHLAPQGEEPALIAATTDAAGVANYYGFSEIDLVNGHGARCFGPGYSRRLAEVHPDWERRYAERSFYDHGLPGSKAGTHRWPYAKELVSSHYIADRAVEFLTRPHDRPFLLHVSFPDPQHPFTVPEPWASMYRPEDMPAPVERADPATMPPWYRAVYEGGGSERVVDGTYNDPITGTVPMDYRSVTPADWRQVKALYYGMVSCLDHHIGRVLAALRSSGLEEATHVVFVADHGEYLGDHGFVGKGYHFRPVLNVPLIHAGYGVTPGRVCAAPATPLDIAPTVLELTGVDEPVGVQGVSYAGYLAGSDAYEHTTAMVENDDDFAGEKLRTLVTDEWKLTWYACRDYGELYYTGDDPAERRNRWADPAVRAVRNALEQQLLEEVVCALDITPPRHQKPAPIPMKWAPRPWAGVEASGGHA